MSLSATVKWVLLAIVGLAIAIGVAIAAANLASQQIGIASESVSAGDALAPQLRTPAEKAPARSGDNPGPPRETTTTTAPAEPPIASEETTPGEAEPPPEGGGDDYGGGGDGDD